MQSYRDRNDETLVLLTLAGETQAYEMLVIRYEKAATAAARSIIRNEDLAKDAAQDAFITGWLKLNCLREPGKYGPWICRIARNCARNTVSRFRNFLSLDELWEAGGEGREEALSHCFPSGEGDRLFRTDAEGVRDPARAVVSDEEKQLLRDKVESLSEKVKTILRMHYFEELSVREIAARLAVSEGTVKRQLYDGRKKLRKELCAMDEKETDTLPMRVRKKVEELLLWGRKKRKTGFEKVYREVLSELEALPESRKQQSATADVLLRGWWWLPEGEKDSEALLARIREAAVKGGNEEVISFLAAKEDGKFYGDTKIAFIKDKQIPRLLEEGWRIAAGREWLVLSSAYFKKEGRTPEDEASGFDALRQAKELLPPGHPFAACADAAEKLYKRAMGEEFRKRSTRRYSLTANVSRFCRVGERVCLLESVWGESAGRMYTSDGMAWYLLEGAGYCDGELTTDTLTPGARITGSDGSTLLYEGTQSVATPAGEFPDCLVFLVRESPGESDYGSYRSFIAPGVGIVRQEHRQDGFLTVTELTSYALTGKGALPGPIPFSKGNRYEYRRAGVSEDVLYEKIVCEVTQADEERALVTTARELVRHRYDDGDLVDLLEQIRGEYWESDEKTGGQKVVDLSPVFARAEQLAAAADVPPILKAHTRAACSVARRIYKTDSRIDPRCTRAWNFFNRMRVRKEEDGALLAGYNFRWSFEWKNMGDGPFDNVVLNNHLLGILQDCTGCLWSPRYRAGYEDALEQFVYGTAVKTKLSVEDAGEVHTPAGRFADCLKLSLETSGLDKWVAYRGGKRAYYFAPGVGMVKMEFSPDNTAVGEDLPAYQLTEYKGEGTRDDYFPLSPGMERKYEATKLPGGYYGAALYLIEADEEGDPVIFADYTGYRREDSEALFYDEIHFERQEERLWDAKKHSDARLRHDLNNFYLALHFLTRGGYYSGVQKKAVAWRKSVLKVTEALFMQDGEIAPALLGLYGKMHFWLCTPLFGCLMQDQAPGDQAEAIREEAYALLEKAISLLEKWFAIPDGTELDVGNPEVFGGVKLLKGERCLLLPDGRREMLPNFDLHYQLHPGNGSLLYGMTAPRGWEWFNPVRDEERFKALIEVARGKNL